MKTRRMVMVCGGALACAAFLGACAEENRRTVLGHGGGPGGVVVLDAFTEDHGSVVDYSVRTESLDRSDWVAIEHVQPVDGVHHTPTYRTIRRTTEGTTRRTGAFPTLDDASGTEEPLFEDQWRDAGIVALRNTVDLMALPVWVFVEPAWGESVSPSVGYERSPEGLAALPATGMPVGAVLTRPMGEAADGEVVEPVAPVDAVGEPVFVEPAPVAPVVDDPVLDDPNAGNPFVRPAPAGTVGAG